MLIEAVQRKIRYRLRDGHEVSLRPGIPMDLPDAAARLLLKKAAGYVRRVESSLPVAPLQPGWLIVYRNEGDHLRGGCDEREAGTVVECRWDGTAWSILLTNGDVLPLGHVLSVGKTDAQGQVIAGWLVKPWVRWRRQQGLMMSTCGVPLVKAARGSVS